MNDVPATMRAVRVMDCSGPSGLRVEEVPVPQPKKGQVLIKVEAAGLNFADVLQSRGTYSGGPVAPYTAGLEAAGRVVAAGEGVHVSVGSRVLGGGQGAFAEYVAWNAQGLTPVPQNWTSSQGASFFVDWFTAHGALRAVGRLKRDEWVLIHASAGGVGSAAVRLAKHFGAKVIATASSEEKLVRSKTNGADVVANSLTEDFVEVAHACTGGLGVDLILEMVGGETFYKNIRALRPFSRMVVYGAASGEVAQFDNMALISRPVELIGYHLSQLSQFRPDLFAAEVREIQDLIQAGVAVPEEPTTYALDDARKAFEAMEARKTIGKVVLIP